MAQNPDARQSKPRVKRPYVRRVDGDKTEEERMLRREKNRIAARDSRARKVQCLADLQQDIAALHEANYKLQERLEHVTEQTEAFRSTSTLLMSEVEHLRLYWGTEVQVLVEHVMQHICGVSPQPTPQADGASSSVSPTSANTSARNLLAHQRSKSRSPRKLRMESSKHVPSMRQGEAEESLQFVPVQTGVTTT